EPAVLRAKGGLDNGSVTILETKDFKTFTCLKWNDTSYKQKKS
ncbi:histidine phosphatase family protein, partial [Streptococcus gallolyticus subsp. gallolyticus]|nr:histidine phosphatase family protein [Streptococcus gallolyticus subsp. gallolyticus]